MSDTANTNTQTTDVNNLPMPTSMIQDTWKNRRKMAYIALHAEVAFTFLAVVLIVFADLPKDRLELVTSVITWFYGAMTSIIGAYIGFTTLAFIKKA